MSKLRLEIDRLDVTLHGLPQTMAKDAIAGLGAELRARLARARWTDAPAAPLAIDKLSISEVASAPDAAGLRAAIAQRLVEQILRVASVEGERMF
jgi:hypothetical protein